MSKIDAPFLDDNVFLYCEKLYENWITKLLLTKTLLVIFQKKLVPALFAGVYHRLNS